MIHTFKIYPHWKMETEKYYEVFIFQNHEQMYKYYKETGGYQPLEFNAVCRDLKVYKGDIPENKIGEILVPKCKCNIELITHECGHVVFQYIRRIHKDKMWIYINQEDNSWKMEEMYCEILGELVKQFMNELNKVLI